jgi:hypothetical protein
MVRGRPVADSALGQPDSWSAAAGALGGRQEGGHERDGVAGRPWSEVWRALRDPGAPRVGHARRARSRIFRMKEPRGFQEFKFRR